PLWLGHSRTLAAKFVYTNRSAIVRRPAMSFPRRRGLHRRGMRNTMPLMALLRLREPLKRLAGNRSEHMLEGPTVMEMLREIERANPPLSGWILDERGRVRPHINLFVNGELAGAETAVGEGDRVDVIPAISGGAND